ncbi:hypothetical protein TNCV_3930161 [Trichonephila clavipes]|nr:hypothetical protein TNCV_3930161 [Trichonephila clavipes]
MAAVKYPKCCGRNLLNEPTLDIVGNKMTVLPERAAPATVARTATANSDVVQTGRPIFDDFFQHLWPYIGNNTANVVFQMVKRLWLIRIHQWLYIAPQN